MLVFRGVGPKTRYKWSEIAPYQWPDRWVTEVGWAFLPWLRSIWRERVI